ncbi:MAG: hypothetical protein ACLP8X_44540 [Streptosporangiaceae bacterium]
MIEVAVSPPALSLEDLGIAALAGSSSNSPFRTYQRSSQHGTTRG